MKRAIFLCSLISILLVCGLLLAGCDLDQHTDDKKIPTYTVTYYANGASGTVPDAQTVNSGSNIAVPDQGSLSYQGKTFNGWNTNANGSGTPIAVGFLLTVNSDITLFAQWQTIITYTLTYNLNGGSGSLPAPQTANPGVSITLAGGSGLSRGEYSFAGWNTNNSGTGNNFNAGASVTLNANTTLYARWTATVTYDINTGSGTAPSVQTVNAGEKVTLSDGSGLSKSGYHFYGWNTNIAGTGNNYDAGSSYTPTGNIKLYANWVEVVNLTAPMINTSLKEKTSDGQGIKITLMTTAAYIDSRTQEYRLYRSRSQYSGYELIGTIPATGALVFEDKTINWDTSGAHHYKVAAASGPNEKMSVNAVMIEALKPEIRMYRSSTNTVYGYCGMDFGDMYYYGTTSSTTRYFYHFVDKSGNVFVTLYSNSAKTQITYNDVFNFKDSHIYRVNILQGEIYEVSFDTSCWSFFSP